MNSNDITLSKIYIDLCKKYDFLDTISSLLNEYNQKYDFDTLSINDIIKYLDQDIINVKGLSEKLVVKAFFKHIINVNHIFNDELRKEFINRLLKIKINSRDKLSFSQHKETGGIAKIHSYSIRHCDVQYLMLRYKYPGFYKENLDIDHFEMYLKSCNIKNLHKFDVCRYFNALDIYLNYNKISFNNSKRDFSIWTVKKK